MVTSKCKDTGAIFNAALPQYRTVKRLRSAPKERMPPYAHSVVSAATGFLLP
jgi:hypothetical protein